MKFKLIITILAITIVVLGVAIFRQRTKAPVQIAVVTKVDPKPVDVIKQPVKPVVITPIDPNVEPEHFDVEIKYAYIIKR